MAYLRNLDSLATNIIIGATFLVPLFFIPTTSLPFQFVKSMLLILAVLSALILWVVARLKTNEIRLPHQLLLLGAGLIPFAYVLSGLFSGNITQSFIGNIAEIDTTTTMLLMFVTLFLGSVLFTTKDRIIRLYLFMIASAGIFALFQVTRLLFGADALTFNLFGSATSNLLGKWNDVAIFFGLTATLIMMTLDLLRVGFKPIKILLYSGLIVSLGLLAVVNFSLIWIMLAIASFLLLVRSFFARRLGVVEDVAQGGEKNSLFSASALITFLVSVVFIFSGTAIGNTISSYFEISQVEVRPSWQSTLDITKVVYAEHILLGSGPNTFAKQWLLYKPEGINTSQFWNIDFAFGVGVIPTSLIATGLVGAFAWTVFLGLFLFAGFRTFIRLRGNKLEDFLAISSFSAALFLWILEIFYVPHVFFLFLAFLFTGIFIAVQRQLQLAEEHKFIFNEKPRVGFMVIGALLIVLLGSVALVYVTATKFISGVYLQKVIVVANTTGDIGDAERYVAQAIAFNQSSRAYQAGAEVGRARLSEIVGRNEDTPLVQQEFQEVLAQTINYAQSAITADNRNYQNWVSLARIYEELIPLQVAGAGENAQVAYKQAVTLNPKNPQLRLQLARIAAFSGDNETAKNYIAEALQLKNNYTDAIFFLSQIEIQEGDIDKAINSVEAAAFLAPNDPTVSFQLGLLKYSKEDFEGAIPPFERAITLNPQYSNARYFLGLSYFQRGDKTKALEQFRVIGGLNPDNAEVEAIINNLSGGNDPFDGFTPPPAPEKRDTPPIEE